MELENKFTVPVPVDEAWAVLLDVERVAPCMPGATLDSVDGAEFTGRVKVKVGPIMLTYRGNARFAERDEVAKRAVIEASGRETRGSGTASATVRATLRDIGGQTEVTVVTDLAVTGKPAQFGRGVMADVAGKIVDQFAGCLAREITTPETVPAAVGTTAEAGQPAGAGQVPGPAATPAAERAPGSSESPPPPPPPARPVPPRHAAEAIDLVDTAAWPVLKRVGPALAVALLLALLAVLARRRRG